MAAAKIDLKARLGRKSAGPAAAPAGPAAPQGVSPGLSPSGPPAAGGGSAPPAAFGSGAPPAQPRPAAAAPQAARSPFGGRPAGGGVPGPGGISIPPPPGFGPKPVAARPESKPPAAQLAIKMEVGEEVVQAQKANRKKTALLAAVAATVGLGLGFGVGQLVKGNEGAQAAVEGSQLLLKEIDDANTELLELEGVLQSAGAKLQGGEYPSEEIEKLGAIDIPFDGANLLNKGIGRYNQTAMTMLIQYVNAVSDVEDQKDKIRRLFGAAKEPFLAELEEKENPKVKWALSVKGGPDGPWASMTLIKPFEVKKDKKADWPDEFEYGKSGKSERYTKGDITKSSGEMIPVDPASQKAVCPDTLALKLYGAVRELRSDLKGDDTPGRERMGVTAMGEKLMDQLRRIGGPG